MKSFLIKKIDACKLNLKEQEQFCIQKIKTYKLDDWSSKQLKLLEK